MIVRKSTIANLWGIIKPEQEIEIMGPELTRQDSASMKKRYSIEINSHVIQINALLTKAALDGFFPDVEVNDGKDRDLKHATIHVTFFKRGS